MTLTTNHSNRTFFFIAGWILLWILLFEFILPVNRFLPAPTLVLQSFVSLWEDYDLLTNLISSVSVVYISLVVSFFLIRFLRDVFLAGKGLIFNLLLSLEWFSEYIPGVIIGILLIFWFPHSDYTEFIFVFSLTFTSLSLSLVKLRKSINKDYSDAAFSLGAEEQQISLIQFNSILPRFTKKFFDVHFYTWTMLIIFEFINESFGVGFILRQAFEYKDLSAFVAASIVIGLIIYAGTLSLKYIRSKFFSWN